MTVIKDPENRKLPKSSRRNLRKAGEPTNAIESVNSVIRKFTRNRKIYPNEESALKIVYLAM